MSLRSDVCEPQTQLMWLRRWKLLLRENKSGSGLRSPRLLSSFNHVRPASYRPLVRSRPSQAGAATNRCDFRGSAVQTVYCPNSFHSLDNTVRSCILTRTPAISALLQCSKRWLNDCNSPEQPDKPHAPSLAWHHRIFETAVGSRVGVSSESNPASAKGLDIP